MTWILRFLNSVFRKYVLFLVTGFVLPGCSGLIVRNFSLAEEHAEKFVRAPRQTQARFNPREQRFEKTRMPSAFIDSVDQTLVSIRMKNQYDFMMIGPPVIPLIPFKSGYGHPVSRKHISPEEMDDVLVVEIYIRPGPNDRAEFVPENFQIHTRVGKQNTSTLISVEGIPDISQKTICQEEKTYRLTFKPGVHVKDLPEVFLHTLNINGKPFHPEGLRFKKGKKLFYSPLMSFNG